MMKRYAIIVAGGSGTRMGSQIPKQFLIVAGQPILMHTLRVFNTYDPEMSLIVVLPQSQIEYWHELCAEYGFDIRHSIATGGATRFESVKNGMALTSADSIIAVHDGVRPLVSPETLDRCYTTAEARGTAIPVMPSIESVRICDADGRSHAADRSKIMMVQTPQVFRGDVLHKAYRQSFSPLFTDDASVVEAMGQTVELTEGNVGNIKITTPMDLILAESMLQGTKA